MDTELVGVDIESLCVSAGGTCVRACVRARGGEGPLARCIQGRKEELMGWQLVGEQRHPRMALLTRSFATSQSHTRSPSCSPRAS